MPLCSLGMDLHSSRILGQERDPTKNGGGNIAILCFSVAHLWVLTPSIAKPLKSTWRSSYFPNLGWFEQQQNQWSNGFWLLKRRIQEPILIEINWNFGETQNMCIASKCLPMQKKYLLITQGRGVTFWGWDLADPPASGLRVVYCFSGCNGKNTSLLL